MVMSQTQPYARRLSPQRQGGAAPWATPGAMIPYDYAASFTLKGIPGNIVQDVLNISSDGVFVAVAIGYGLQEERSQPIEEISGAVTPNTITLNQIPLDALLTGFRLQALPAQFGVTLLQRLKAPHDISFLFSIVDSASGRELQDEPTHNLASLGKSNGERPFRQLAQPLTFMPRSTVRLQIIERSERVKGTLFIVLYGYKIFAASSCPEPLMRRAERAPHGPSEAMGIPSERVVPFDYVARLELTGRAENVIETEVPVNTEGGFVATGIGYGLETGASDIPVAVPSALINDPNVPEAQKTFKLAELPLSALPPDKLTSGLRLRASLLRAVLESGGTISNSVRLSVAGKIFESLNRAEEVSFRYTLFDGGTGRELQNQPIHNIAGLGIANGDRPFKRFAKPMIFQPRSTIRVSVQEHFGRGMLYLAFHGYKVLGSHLQGARR